MEETAAYGTQKPEPTEPARRPEPAARDKGLDCQRLTAWIAGYAGSAAKTHMTAARMRDDLALIAARCELALADRDPFEAFGVEPVTAKRERKPNAQ